MPTAKLYPELLSVRIPVALAESIEDRMSDDDDESYEGGLSGALRDAALRAIGRPDLLMDDSPTPSTSGKQASRRADARWVVLPVKLTTQQKRAIVEAAKAREAASSSLMVDALCAELQLPPRAPMPARRSAKSMRSRIRELAQKLDPTLKLPVADGFAVSLELRQRVAKKLGSRTGIVARALQARPDQVGWQIGRRRSSPPKKR